jgi:serine phosphatase RsbU (regulator of sigma subunit)
MHVDHGKFLAENKLLKGMTERQLTHVDAMLRAENFAPGDTIVREAEAPERVYLLAEGRAEVRRQGQDPEASGIAGLVAGDFFGEMAMIMGAAVHSSSVIAVTPVTTFSLNRADFTRILDDYPEATRNILSNVILQLQVLNGKWLETLRKEKEVLERKVRERTAELEAISERVQRELVLAQRIQRNLLPDKRKSFPGIVIATDYIPCEELGGDITGVFQVDETRLAVYGGDVCGHGVYAAMVMSYVKKLIETSVKRLLVKGQYVVKPPGAVLTSINQSFIAEINQGDPEIYLTLFLGVLDIRRLTFEFSSAGIHVPPVVFSAGEAAELFHQSDFPIGHIKDHEYETERRSFLSGDSFLFVSDGVIEARRGEKSFGMERLKSEALRIMQETGRLEIDGIMQSVRDFLGTEPPQDDICLLTMAFEAQQEPTR